MALQQPGFTAVNPANDNEWFVATPPDSASGVNLFRCANGINCHSQDFQRRRGCYPHDFHDRCHSALG